MKRFFSLRLFDGYLKRLKDKSEMMQRVIQSDDMLEINAQWVKPGNEKLKRRKSRFENLKPNFINIIQSKYGASSKAIVYRNKTKDDGYIKKVDYVNLPQSKKSNYYPVNKYHCQPSEYTHIEYYSNNLSIRIHNLSYCDKSRYREIMQTIADSELFRFKHRTAYPTNIQIFDATRAMLDRRFNIRRYEWGLIFNHDISSVIHTALNRIVTKNIPGVRREKNTVYLHESNSYKIKIYNITVADDKNRRNEEPEFKSGDRLKFEITYRTAYFKSHNIKTHHLKTQNVIVDLFSSSNEKLFEKYFLRILIPQEKRDLFKIAKVSGESEFLEFIANGIIETSAEKIIDEISSDSEKAMQSLDEQYKAQTDLVDEELIKKIKLQNKIHLFKKDMRKVRSVE